jgi:hypothetical protein
MAMFLKVVSAPEIKNSEKGHQYAVFSVGFKMESKRLQLDFNTGANVATVSLPMPGTVYRSKDGREIKPAMYFHPDIVEGGELDGFIKSVDTLPYTWRAKDGKTVTQTSVKVACLVPSDHPQANDVLIEAIASQRDMFGNRVTPVDETLRRKTAVIAAAQDKGDETADEKILVPDPNEEAPF